MMSLDNTGDVRMDGNLNNEKVVLVVDDLFENLLILKKMLEKCGYTPITASSAKDALDMIRMKMPELILLDVYMPEMDGFELCEILKNDINTKDIPIVFISAGMSNEDKVKGFSMGAVDFINKPFALEEVSLRVNNHVQMYEMRKNTEEYTKKLNKMVKDHVIRIKEEQKNTIRALEKMFFLHFPEKEATFKNMAHNCRFIAQALEFSEKYEKQINATFIDSIEEAVLLHDIGRISAQNADGDNHVCHEECGVQFLEDLSFLSEHNEMLQMAIDGARYHNEKWDGTGKPACVMGEDIPVSARILAVCRRFEKECSNLLDTKPDATVDELRDYAVTAIQNDAGMAYEPELVKIFAQVSRQLSVLK